MRLDIGQDRRTESATVRLEAEADLPTEFGRFKIAGFRSVISDEEDEEFVALIKGEIDAAKPALVRIHSQCLTGDVFHSLKCDCGLQLRRAMQMIKAAGAGVIVYQQQEGRGIGIINKIRAYALQDQGADTIEANLKLGFAVDAREYNQCAEIIKQLGARRVRLMSNNPDKVLALRNAGLEVVERVPLEIKASPPAFRYLLTKADGSSAATKQRLSSGGVVLRKLFALVLILPNLPLVAERDRPPALEVVASVELSRYSGKWYEVARLPNQFQKKCAGEVTATYSQLDDGQLKVVNECRQQNGQIARAEGRARLAGERRPNSKLKVRFAPAWLGWLPTVWGDYWIIALAPDYSYSVVGSPDRKYLWILSRTPQMDEAVYQRIIEQAAAKGFDVSRLVKTRQSG